MKRIGQLQNFDVTTGGTKNPVVYEPGSADVFGSVYIFGG